MMMPLHRRYRGHAASCVFCAVNGDWFGVNGVRCGCAATACDAKIGRASQLAHDRALCE